jgi:cell division protein FtsI (penicillin-binding protein 3)
MLKKSKKILRKVIIAFFVLLFFAILLLKLFYVQIILHNKITNSVNKMLNKNNIANPKRGNIFDCKGSILATSIKQYTVFIDSKMIDDFYKTKSILQKHGIEIGNKDLKDFNNKSYIPVGFNIDIDKVERLKKLNLKGIGFEPKYVRYYPEGKLLSNVLGITDYYGHGVEGIEKIYDEYLSGNRIITKMYRDGRGRIIMRDKFINLSEIQGHDVILTIDKNIQFIAEQEMKKAFLQHNAKKAICIVQNSNDSRILAMVSLSNENSLRNSAVSDSYEPGSTFKIVALSAAINMNKLDISDKFDLENGKLKMAGHIFKDDHKINGVVQLNKVISLSSNIGMIKIAQRIGNMNFYNYIRKFGFYSLSGIDLPGECKGILIDVKNWNSLTLPTISFGQGICVTPIQLINAFSAIANGGTLQKPYIVQEIKGINNAIRFQPKKIRKVISSETANKVIEILNYAVEFGTGKNARLNRYSVAGKTGTAQKIDIETKKYSSKNYIASFCGIVTVNNSKIIILVIIDEPRNKSYYASSVAVPVFSSIATKVCDYLNV